MKKCTNLSNNFILRVLLSCNIHRYLISRTVHTIPILRVLLSCNIDRYLISRRVHTIPIFSSQLDIINKESCHLCRGGARQCSGLSVRHRILFIVITAKFETGFKSVNEAGGVSPRGNLRLVLPPAPCSVPASFSLAGARPGGKIHDPALLSS